MKNKGNLFLLLALFGAFLNSGSSYASNQDEVTYTCNEYSSYIPGGCDTYCDPMGRGCNRVCSGPIADPNDRPIRTFKGTRAEASEGYKILPGGHFLACSPDFICGGGWCN